MKIYSFKMRTISFYITLLILMVSITGTWSQRRVRKLKPVFVWKQLTYEIDGLQVLQNRFGSEDFTSKKGQSWTLDDKVYFNDDEAARRSWRPWVTPSQNTTTGPTDESGRYFIQYNNLPMGVEKVGNRLFITVPRRRYGIPSTLNFIDLSSVTSRSPPLRPYPADSASRSTSTLVSVYRTRADSCNRLWMVDTGLLEIPNNPQQLQPPAIVIFDLNTDQQILRYQFKAADLPAANTPTGLASITVDVGDDCSNAFAYVPDLTTYGLIVYSLRDNDSWRLSHNYFHFSPVAGNLNIANLSFQWSDGIFSVTLSEVGTDGCRTAYFHAMVGTHEFSISTCLLQNRTASNDGNYWTSFKVVGDRGANSQSTMHGYHAPSRVIFFADIMRNGVSCWRARTTLQPEQIAVLAQDERRMIYPSDLHVTGNEVWVMTNSLPRYGYARLDTNEDNFYVYRGDVNEMISGTVCDDPGTKAVWA